MTRMIYKFKSKASGDLIMLGAAGDQLLRLVGREPAERGIFETADMPALEARLAATIAQAAQPHADEPADPARAEPEVALRQRLWPMIEMLRRCHAASEPIVWGV
jgi:Domain of unknown function (DUF1840)